MGRILPKTWMAVYGFAHAMKLLQHAVAMIASKVETVVLALLMAKTWHNYTVKDGLIHNRVYDVVADPKGGVWLANPSRIKPLQRWKMDLSYCR